MASERSSKGNRKYEKRMSQTHCQVRYTNLDFSANIARGDDGLFKCCVEGCNRTYADPVSIQRHGANHQAGGKTAASASAPTVKTSAIEGCSESSAASTHKKKKKNELTLNLSNVAEKDRTAPVHENDRMDDAVSSPEPVPPTPMSETMDTSLLTDAEIACDDDDHTTVAVKYSAYMPVPTEHTVASHSNFNFEALGITIDTFFKCIVCMVCQRAIEPRTLSDHAYTHNPYYTAPDEIEDALIDEFNLIPLMQVAYPTEAIKPVFGIPIEDECFHFCGVCHRGYQSLVSLGKHQSNPDRCVYLPPKERTSHVYPAQILHQGQHRQYFPVNISGLSKSSPATADYWSMLGERIRPTDYTQLPLRLDDESLNTNSFFYNEQWMDAVDGFTPEQIIDAARLPDPQAEPWGQRLQQASRRYMAAVQKVITKNQGFGITQKIAQFYPDADQGTYDVRPIQKDTQRKYGDKLYRLLFAVIRSEAETGNSDSGTGVLRHLYPFLDESQVELIDALAVSLVSEDDAVIDLCFHNACYTLFAHERHVYETSKDLGRFFSPVSLFLIYLSVKQDGGFQQTSDITSSCAALEYAIRGTILIEVDKVASHERISIFKALEPLERYLQTMHETPMAFICNAHRALKRASETEVNNSDFHLTDPLGREVTYKGHILRTYDLKRMHDEELVQYKSTLKQQIYLGEEIPSYCQPAFEINKLVDHANNAAVGYSFIDDHRNGFDKYQDSFAKWLLSDPERASLYTFHSGDKLYWRSEPARELLEQLESIQSTLAVGTVYSALLLPRSSEIARLQLRNTSTAERNLRIENHRLAYVSLQDKTSHRLNRKLYVPHPVTDDWAEELIKFLVVIRPFMECLVKALMDNEVLNRFRFQLWPGLEGAMTGDKFSRLAGEVTSAYFGIELRPLRFRSFMTALSHYVPNTRQFYDASDSFLDLAMMHSTTMANRRYGRRDEQHRDADKRIIYGAIRAALNMQKHVGIGQNRPPEPSPSDNMQKGSSGNDLHLSEGLIDSISDGVLKRVLNTLEGSLKEVVLDSMADAISRFIPKTVSSIDDNDPDAPSYTSPHPSLLTLLRAFLNDDDATFTCAEQAELVERMLRGTESVLGIIGTGKGKTLAILLVAYILRHQGVTLVILPLSSLHDDLARRAREHRIIAARWSPGGKFDENASLVYVAVEHLMHDSFKTYLRTLEATNRLNTIVFDEIHKVLTDISYRKAFGSFSTLNLVKTPIVGLSGTIPRCELDNFIKLTQTTWRVIRTSSVRPELEYDIRKVPASANFLEYIASDAKAILKTYADADRMLVFCRSHNDAKTLADLLDVPVYTSATRDDNEDTMMKWRQGIYRVIVATSLLGCGLDNQDVRDVIHAKTAHDMIGQQQQESRAGRDGKHARCITYVPSEPEEYQPNPKAMSEFGRRELNEWSRRPKQCIRIIPTAYIDGKPTTCMMIPKAILCSYCRDSASKPLPRLPINLAKPAFDACAPARVTVVPPLHTLSTSVPARSTDLLSPVIEDGLEGNIFSSLYETTPPVSDNTPSRYSLPAVLSPTTSMNKRGNADDDSTSKRQRLSDPSPPPVIPSTHTSQMLSSSSSKKPAPLYGAAASRIPSTKVFSSAKPRSATYHTASGKPLGSSSSMSQSPLMLQTRNARTVSFFRAPSASQSTSVFKTPNPPSSFSFMAPPSSLARVTPQPTGSPKKSATAQSTPSGRMSVSSTSSRPSLPPPPNAYSGTPSAMARVDNVRAVTSHQRFEKNIVQPVIAALNRCSLDVCITCICLGLDWKKIRHHHDTCAVSSDSGYMHRKHDLRYKTFQSSFKVWIQGICFACYLQGKDFDHHTNDEGTGFGSPNCRYRGILSRVMFAVSWGKYPVVRGYPGIPDFDISRPEFLLDLQQWAISTPVGSEEYPGKNNIVVYDIFLWLMRRAKVIV